VHNRNKVMLGMSLFKANCGEAGNTACAFSKVLWKEDDVVLGVETDGLGRDTPEMRQFVRDRLSEGWSEKRVYIWDEESDNEFFGNWPSNRLAVPSEQN